MSSGCKLHEFILPDLVTSTSEDGRNVSTNFSLNVTSTFMVMLHVLFGESEMVLFLVVGVFSYKGIFVEVDSQRFSRDKML